MAKKIKRGKAKVVKRTLKYKGRKPSNKSKVSKVNKLKKLSSKKGKKR